MSTFRVLTARRYRGDDITNNGVSMYTTLLSTNAVSSRSLKVIGIGTVLLFCQIYFVINQKHAFTCTRIHFGAASPVLSHVSVFVLGIYTGELCKQKRLNRSKYRLHAVMWAKETLLCDWVQVPSREGALFRVACAGWLKRTC